MLDNYPQFKRTLHYMLIHPYSARTRWWVRTFLYPFIIKRGRGSIIRHSVRLDLIPSKTFRIGYRAIIESGASVNNCMGDVTIGDNSLITCHTSIVGPVRIGNNVAIASKTHMSGLTHNYEDVLQPIVKQGVSVSQVIIEDDVWIGANVCINQGVTIGTHSLVGSGSVVTKDIPPYSVAVGCPARIVRHYDFEKKAWVKVENKNM